MGVQGASFVRVVRDRDACFRDTCQLLREKTRPPWHHIARMYPGSDWICIEEAVDDGAVDEISGVLHTTIVTLYAIDEKRPRFSYQRVVDGRRVRQLVFEYSGYPMRGEWTRIEGESEAWEAVLFRILRPLNRATSVSFTALHAHYSFRGREPTASEPKK